MSENSCQFCGLYHNDGRKCKFSYETECPFGCETFGYSPEQLKQHREERFLDHLNKLYSVLSFYGYGNNLDYSSELETLVIAEMKKDLEEIKSLKEEAIFLTKKLAMKTRERKEQMKLLEKAIEDSSLTSFNGTLTWIIPESKRKDKTLRSPIFYTGKYGYKLKLKIERDPDLKIFLLIMKGTYDAVLHESFTATVTFECGEMKKNLEKLVGDEKTLFRLKTSEKLEHKENLIAEDLNFKDELEVIRFKIDCSEFSLSSID